VLRAVRRLLSEENSFSFSSSLSSLSPELKAHLVSCSSCAAEARALDPVLLFVPLAAAFSPAPPEEDARRVAADVLAEVRRRSRVSSPRAGRHFLSRRFLEVAALVALAAGLFGVGGARLARREPVAPAAPAAVASAPDEGRDAPDSPGTREAARRSDRPLIQDLKNPGARVYEFAAVSPKEPSVVFIADPHADL
jgi:hypothetical protein